MAALFYKNARFRKPLPVILLLTVLALVLYLPVSWSDYLYTDEAVQLWHYRPGSGYHMFIGQGRYITDRLVAFLFSHTESISGLRYVRLASLLCWIACIPVWYLILRGLCRREGIHGSVAFLVTAWLLCSPTCTISIAWASCAELFLAYTAGLVSGYCFYRVQSAQDTERVRGYLLLFSIVAGLAALFTYQNGIGCFFLPFVIRVLGGRAPLSKNISALIFAVFITVIYYLLFRSQLQHYGISAASRTATVFQPLKKLTFFFTRPFVAAWFFGIGYNETNRRVLFYVLPVLLFVLYLSYRYLLPGQSARKKLASVFVLLVLCLASYFPSLLVKENYASARTTLALSLVTFTWFIVLCTRWTVTRPATQRAVVLLVLAFAVTNCLYNFHIRFLGPQVTAHREAVAAFTHGYDARANSFTWQMPAEDAFEKRYGIVRSWDEFGVPSLFFPWVPEFYFKQLLLDQTGDRDRASALTVKTLPAALP